jgi:hypothetical protein
MVPAGNANTQRLPDGARWRNKWAIGIYGGPNPLQLGPLGGMDRPVLSARDVTDIPACAVADPFFLRIGTRWYLFFEAFNGQSGLGEIAYATSTTGLDWSYGEVVLRESFHLSYPQVFAWDSQIYMIPETRQAESVRLYVAQDFPRSWRLVTTLLEGPFADATILRREDRWWLFAQRGLDELRLYGSSELREGWREHPSSPLFAGNRRHTRPAGRMILYDGRLLRFAQDGWPSYGTRVLAFEIDRLSESDYQEHEVAENPVLRASGSGWNAVGMHHLDAVPLADGSWLAAVDGASLGLY